MTSGPAEGRPEELHVGAADTDPLLVDDNLARAGTSCTSPPRRVQNVGADAPRLIAVIVSFGQEPLQPEPVEGPHLDSPSPLG